MQIITRGIKVQEIYLIHCIDTLKRNVIILINAKIKIKRKHLIKLNTVWLKDFLNLKVSVTV